MASKGFSVSVCNRSHDKVDTTVQRAVAEGNLPLKGFKDVRFCVSFLMGIEEMEQVMLVSSYLECICALGCRRVSAWVFSRIGA